MAATGSATAAQGRGKIYPRTAKGLYTRWRWFFVFATQLFFYGMPWLQWGGRQAMLFDIDARRFYIFGLVLYPQDVFYLAALLIISALLLFLFTAVAGRQWCGYACPQTVYTEIFLWVEEKFEGSRAQRLRLDAAPLSWNKLWRKAGKHLVWIAIGLWTGFTFVGYFTPIRGLAASIAAFSVGPWALFWVLFYGFATWGNAGFMREQVCKYMCPYARFQGAMFDRDTLIVTYVKKRGDPRGKRSKKVDPKAEGLGDCIDCTLCVQVCPTGIDIRDGLQYECISCAACIDACDDVMDTMGYPRGLIRYSTEAAIDNDWSTRDIVRRVLRPRVLVYATVLTVAVVVFVTSLWVRTPFKVDVMRDRATLARLVKGGEIENVYRIHIMNATEQEQRFTLDVDGLPGLRLAEGTEAAVTVAPEQSTSIPVQLRLPYGAQAAGSHGFDFVVSASGVGHVREKSVFFVPQ